MQEADHPQQIEKAEEAGRKAPVDLVKFAISPSWEKA
jgi:hypothetical protein